MKITVTAEKRDAKGTGASRRLRRNGKVPGILYGNHKDAGSLILDSKTLHLQFHKEAVNASILDLSTDRTTDSVVLRDTVLEHVKAPKRQGDVQGVDHKRKLQ